ncbi:MAG: phage tail tape measure protein [Desulfuromonas sp.]|nr:phage tail tape measure protein [Desulfuromonas sp.]
MEKSLSLGVVIGATLASSFSSNIGTATDKFNTLGTAVKGLGKSSEQLKKFQQLSAELPKSRQAFSAARREVGNFTADLAAAKKAAIPLKNKLAAASTKVEQLQDAMVRSVAPTKAMRHELKLAKHELKQLGAEYKPVAAHVTALSNNLNTARGTLRKTKRTIANQIVTLKKYKSSLREAGVDTKKLASEQVRLGSAFDKAEVKLKKLQRRLNKKQVASSKLGGLRNQMLGGIGALYGAGQLVGEAADFGRSATRLSTVINAKDIGKQLALSRKHALAFARGNLASETEILDIEYALNSAGLDAQTSRIGSEIVSKVAKVTGSASEGVGEVVATVFNNLGNTLEGTTEQRLQRIGDLLTKTQFKFQLRDFDQLGESFKMATPALAQYNVDLAQGATLLGALNSAGMQGSMAGTALSATFRNMSKASRKFGFEMAHNADGGLDFIATLKNMSDAIGGFDGMDQQTIDDLQSTFGDEGVRMVALLGPKLKELAASQDDVAKSSRGVVDASYSKFLNDTRGQLTLFTNNVRTLGMAFAGALLPAVNSLLKPVTTFAGWVGVLLEKFPAVATIIGGAVTGFALFQGGIMAVTAAQWLWNAALLANPIGLVVAGIGAAAALVIHYWEPITTFFGDMWSDIKNLFSAGVSFLTEVWEHSPLGLLFKAGQKLGSLVGSFFGGDDKSSVPTSGKPQPASMAKPMELVKPFGIRSSSKNTTLNAPITIHAAPGMDAHAVAEQVDQALRQREQQAAANQRGNLYD